MTSKRERGFTLIEVIVVAGIIAILAGILVPLILKQIDESRITRATADIRSISNAMIIFKKDTGQWPNLDATCQPNVTVLLSGTSAVLPNNFLPAGWNTTTIMPYNNYLQTDGTTCYSQTTPPMWQGAYMGFVTNDPWGNPYVTNADGFSLAPIALGVPQPVWILSAGPDGVIETVPTAAAPMGDDIGIRLQ
ncbi:MAG: prepilin-type N-terminal cleavage/methylation domain-containing protein [Thermodesulfovibrionales bacterium]|jgi:general secretion pathway protein G